MNFTKPIDEIWYFHRIIKKIHNFPSYDWRNSQLLWNKNIPDLSASGQQNFNQRNLQFLHSRLTKLVIYPRLIKRMRFFSVSDQRSWDFFSATELRNFQFLSNLINKIRYFKWSRSAIFKIIRIIDKIHNANWKFFCSDQQNLKFLCSRSTKFAIFLPLIVEILIFPHPMNKFLYLIWRNLYFFFNRMR